ncbi:MAG: hypothetical protein IT317_01315 [Anaerolineales bacterium]|nr:hypothetical protein [Anaerolineales bacterium]
MQVGDVLLAIDGIPTRYTDLAFRFGPKSPAHIYAFSRGQEVFSVSIASGIPTPLELLNLLLPALVALEAWLVGFVIVLMARQRDRDAWHLGVVLLAFSVALVAAPAGGAGVPGARLAYGVLLPVASVGYFEMAFLPDRDRWRSSILFRILYAIAALLAAGIIFEVLFLNPDSSWTSVLGVRLEALSLALLALSFLSTPFILTVRARRQQSGYSRRQAGLLLLGTGVALLPFVLFTALPQAITSATLLPVELTLPLLGAIPATYAYVIYRHRFLKLDLYAGRTLLLLVAGLIVSVIFFSSLRLSQASRQLASISPVVGMISVLVAVGVVSQANSRLKPAIDVLLYGPDRHFNRALQVLTGELTANPQSHTLHQALVKTVPAILEVRDAALFLPDQQGQLVLAASTGMQVQHADSCTTIDNIEQALLFQSAPEAELFRHYPWARLALPLRGNDATRGILVLGAKAADAPFDFQEITFVEQAVGASAIAVENIRLFEALQEVAEDRLRVRSAERRELALRLHDEPLQRTYTLAHGLEIATAALPQNHPVLDLLRAQVEELRRLSNELRDISAGLRPPIMNQGLLLPLKQIIRTFEEKYPDLNFELILALEDEPQVSQQAVDAAYHVVTEALNNVIRHAAAKNARVTLEALSDGIRICITDDGGGTPLSTLSLPELVRDRHFGIAGMHEWAEMANGRLRMMATSPTGTSVELYLPFADNQAN